MALIAEACHEFYVAEFNCVTPVVLLTSSPALVTIRLSLVVDTDYCWFVTVSELLPSR